MAVVTLLGDIVAVADLNSVGINPAWGVPQGVGYRFFNGGPDIMQVSIGGINKDIPPGMSVDLWNPVSGGTLSMSAASTTVHGTYQKLS